MDVGRYAPNNRYFMIDHSNNFMLQSGTPLNDPSTNSYERWEPRARLRPNNTHTTPYSANPLRRENWATGDFRIPANDAPTTLSYYYKPHIRPTSGLGLWDTDKPYYAVPKDTAGTPIVYEMCLDSERANTAGEPFLTPHIPDMKRFWLSAVTTQPSQNPNSNVPWERTYHEFQL